MRLKVSAEPVQKRNSIKVIFIDPPDIPASDKSKKRAKLSRARARQLARLILLCVKPWKEP